MSENPKVTVLMPVYNGEKYLKKAIDSILCQTFNEFEFLIINDGSTDRSIEVIKSYSDPRIILVENGENLGLIATLNKGIDLARGKYIARMDQDDISVPDRFEKQIKYLDSNHQVGVLGSNFLIIDNQGNRLDSPMIFATQHEFVRWGLNFYSPIVHPSVMMRKDLIVATGGYSSEYLHVEDYDLWVRLSRITHLSNLPDILLTLRKHDTNITKTAFLEHIYNGDKVSQLIISEQLGETVSSEVIKCLTRSEKSGIKNAIEAGEIIFKLCLRNINAKELSDIGRELIRQDAVILNQHLLEIRIWKLFFFALKIDILYTLKIVLQAPYYVVHSVLLKK